MIKMSEVKNETKTPTFLFHAHNLDFCSTYHCFFHIELNRINFRIFKLLINFLKNTVFLCKTNKMTLQYWNHSGLRHRPLTLEWFKIHKSIHGLWYVDHLRGVMKEYSQEFKQCFFSRLQSDFGVEELFLVPHSAGKHGPFPLTSIYPVILQLHVLFPLQSFCLFSCFFVSWYGYAALPLQCVII